MAQPILNGEQLVDYAIQRSPVSRGLAIVVANQKSRVFPEAFLYGVKVDFHATCTVFENLQYAVVPLLNSSKHVIVDVVAAAAKLFPECDGEDPRFQRIVFTFAGHGDKDSQIHTEDGEIDVQMEIMWPLLVKECPRLRHIPKLFFIDACRGGGIDRPIARGPGHNHPVYSRTSGLANYLLVQSTLPSKKAFEIGNNEGGYWTQAFLAELQKSSNVGRDIGYILIEVNRHVNAMFNIPQHDCIQQAITENTLLDHVIFLDPNEAQQLEYLKLKYFNETSTVWSTNEPSALGGQATTSVAASPVQQLGQSPQSRSGSNVSTIGTPQAQGSTLGSPPETFAPRGPIIPTPISLPSSHSVSPGPSASSTVSPVTELEQKLKEEHGGFVVIEYQFKEERGGYRATLLAPVIGCLQGTEVCASKSKAKKSVAAEALRLLQSLD